ncbi:hypothetical protein A8135_06045 [Legionella jamestowniensis]|uniref:Uncharacterized protein n=2 Tax=Legionella jamestowniensis TaxID=455 RepID=A0ABX2XRE5_9GAMM|nr:hypothetical protein A8135_06045 [Legionella jamestowniensis]
MQLIMFKAIPFFTAVNSNNSETMPNSASVSKTPVEIVKKYVDAQIEYNNFLKERLTHGKQEEIFEIFLSLFLDLSEVPRLVKIPPKTILQKNVGEFIGHIEADLEEYERIKTCLDTHTTVDQLYLTIYFTYKQWLFGIDDITSKKIKNILSYVYDGNELKKKVKEVIKRVNMKSSKSPLLCEINSLFEICTMLQSEVSDDCLRFKDDISIKSKNGYIFLSLPEESNRKERQFLDKNPDDQEFLSLLKRSTEAYDALESKNISTDLHTSYLNLFAKMKVKYRIDEEIKTFMQRAAEKKQASLLESTVMQTEGTENFSERVAIQPAQLSLNSNENSVLTTAVQCEQTSQEEKHSSNAEFSAKKITHQLAYVESHEQASTLHCSSSPMTEEVDIPTVSFKDEEEIEQDLNKENNAECSYSPDYSLFPPKIKEQPKKETRRNILNLNKEQQETFLKVFGLISYDSINLRALVNLTQALGGTIKTTGANRCRIEIKNIYAHLLVPEEALNKACKKATVTMHGGGHRNKASQNNDREKAPDYLISQFRAAFVRAGYTPINLGLGVENAPPLSGTHVL